MRKRICKMLCCALLAFGLAGCTAEEVSDASAVIVEALPGETGEAADSEEGTSFLDSIYDDVIGRMDEEGSIPELEGANVFDRTMGMFMNGWQKTYRAFRSLSPIIVICSVAIGILTMVLARQNKQIKRTGLYIFIIGIPVAVIVAVFGIGIMNGVLMGW